MSHVRHLYNQALIQELNNELFESTRDGHTRFYNPEGTHDDPLWACALGAYASREPPARTQLVQLKL